MAVSVFFFFFSPDSVIPINVPRNEAEDLN